MQKNYNDLNNSNSKPRSFLRSCFDIVSENFSISHKLDGEHRILILEENEFPVLLNSNNQRTTLNKLPKWKNKLCILEGEYYENKIYLFDMLFFNGESITSQPFVERYRLMKLKYFSDYLFICIKKFYFPKTKNRIFFYARTLLKEKTQYPIDGLIFMPNTLPYFSPSAMVYKWKPPEMLTIDFLCRRVSRGKYKIYAGINKKQFLKQGMHHLPEFKGFRATDYFPIEFNPKQFRDTYENLSTVETPVDDFDEKIVEMRFDVSTKKWIPIKIREDKTQAYLSNTVFSGPNNWNTALSIFNETLDPISEKELLSHK
jgi:hypothetical protein